jgi:cytochrome oxidase assembly protein ShyY1
MGIWLELGVFLVVLAFGFWQLHDVKKAIRERENQQARNKAEAPAPTDR